MKVKKEIMLLAVIIIAGAALRLWGIGFGLPFQFHQDEPIVVNHALAYGTGDFNPYFFAIPPLTSYLLFFIYGLYFIIGKMTGFFPTLHSFALSFFKDPTAFYLMGRVFIGALPGVLCIPAAYILHKRLFGSPSGALFTAAVMAFSFSNVVDSHYIYTDMLMSLAIILSIFQIARLMKNPSLKNYILSGIVIGIASGIKYNAALLLAAYFTAHFVISGERKKNILSKEVLSGLVFCVVSFFMVNPFGFLDIRSFSSALKGQGAAESYIGPMHHIVYSLGEGIGIPILISGIIGLACLIVRDIKKGIFLISFPALFYIHLIFFSQPFPRYAIPMIPFLALGSGYLMFEYIPIKFKGPFIKKAVILLLLPILLLQIAKSVKAGFLFNSVDTRIKAADWIRDNVSPKEKIALDHTFFRPAIIQNKKQLMDKYEILGRQKSLAAIKDKKLNLMLEAQKGKIGYYIYFLSLSPETQGQFLSTSPSLPFDYGLLKEKGIEYVTVNYSDRQKGTEGFYRQLRENGILVASFSPYKDGSIRFSYDMTATTCLPLAGRELYSRKRNGPALEIYRIR